MAVDEDLDQHLDLYSRYIRQHTVLATICVTETLEWRFGGPLLFYKLLLG